MDSKIKKLIDQTKTETDPFLKAKLMQSLVRDHDLRLNRLAPLLSLKPSYLCHYLRLNRLPELVVDGYYAKNISLSHLFVISRIKDRRIVTGVYEKVLSRNLTVLETEELVREVLYGVKTEGKALTSDEKADYIDQFDKEVKAKIIQTRIKSKLIVEIKGSLEKTSQALRLILERMNKK